MEAAWAELEECTAIAVPREGGGLLGLLDLLAQTVTGQEWETGLDLGVGCAVKVVCCYCRDLHPECQRSWQH